MPLSDEWGCSLTKLGSHTSLRLGSAAGENHVPAHQSVLGLQRGKVNEPNCLCALKMHMLIFSPWQLVFFLQRTNKTLPSSFTTRFYWVDTGLGDLQWHSESQKWEEALSGDQWMGQKLTWQLPRCFTHSSVYMRMTANLYSHCIKWKNGKKP